MTDKLDIISRNEVSGVSSKDIDKVINSIIVDSKQNMDAISELTLECSAFLTSAKSRSSSLSEQKGLTRLLNGITGKNRKIRDAIMKDNNNAMYAAQGVINRVYAECVNNRALFCAVNNKLNDFYLELKENQLDINDDVLQIRETIVAFYETYRNRMAVNSRKIDKINAFTEGYCPACNNTLRPWQKICTKCGCIHPLKTDNMGDDTMGILNKVSDIIKDDSLSEEAVWDVSVQKMERALRKIKSLSEVVSLPGYTEELSRDIDNVIRQCNNAEFQIAIVGVMKAGKSYLMNALIGSEIASVEVNPETAALTKFRSADGFYVKLKFHTKVQWAQLKNSAEKSTKTGEGTLAELLADPEIKKTEGKWIGHQDLVHRCGDVKSLQEIVRKYTSSKSKSHIFVSEVEVGIDKSIFNMPREVVFVDTPGLKDPVSYRSEITRRYMKKANAVLIALRPGPLTVEGQEIVSTVLDCTQASKAYIVGTRSDENSRDDQEKYLSNWVDLFIKTKRYGNKRAVKNRIILTSAKMELLINKWCALSEAQKEDENCFSNDDYNDLESYCGKILRKRRYDLTKLTDKDADEVRQSTGISVLRTKLEVSLISKFRDFKRDEIKKALEPHRQQLQNIGQNTIAQQELTMSLAKQGATALKKEKDALVQNYDTTKRECKTLRAEAKRLETELKALITKYKEET